MDKPHAAQPAGTLPTKLHKLFKLDPKAFAILVLGPSGVGKTSVCHGVQAKDRDVGSCVTTTTRPRRDGEAAGVDYHFVPDAVFRQRLARGDFVEHAEVHGFLYGATVEAVSEVLSRGRVMLLDVDTQGAETWKKALGSRCVTVFVLPPSWEVLERRLKDRRTENEASFKRRMQNAQKELDCADRYDYLMINDQLKVAVFQLQQIIDAERRRPCRMRDALSEFRTPQGLREKD